MRSLAEPIGWRARLRPGAGVVPLAALTVISQIGYPLTNGRARDRLTIATVVTFAAASLLHAASTRQRLGAACCAIAAGIGLAAEIMGVHSGLPFGRYSYAASLGPAIAGAPLVVALAWAMMAWPAALVGRALAGSFPVRAAIGMWALASWDLFLDPQMVAAGHWRWAHPDPHLPGVTAVPLTNFAGWLVVSGVISVVSQGLLAQTHDADDRPMLALYAWVWISSVVAGLVFLDLRAAAAWAGVCMGVVVVPLALWRPARGASRDTA